MANSSRPKKLCVYCQINEKEGYDHIIPQALFLEMLPPIMWTAPACGNCNQNLKGKLEEYFSQFLALSMENGQNPVARAIFDGKITRSIVREEEHHRPRLPQEIMERGETKSLYTPSGIYLGEVSVVPIDSTADIYPVIEMIVKGLYYRETKQYFPTGIELKIFQVPLLSKAVLWDAFLRCEQVKGPYTLGYNGEYPDYPIGEVFRSHLINGMLPPNEEERDGFDRRAVGGRRPADP